MDKEIKQEFNNLHSFLRENMATKQDLAELRAEMATKADIESLRNAVDAYAKLAKDYYQEVTVFIAKVSRIEAWIKEAAPKLGIEYKV